MDALTRRRALLAAMKATLTAGATLGALACGATTEAASSEDGYKKDVPCGSLDGSVSSDAAGADARKPSDASLGDAKPAANACEVEQGDAGYSQKARLCCTASLTADFADAGDGWVTLSDTADHLACCHAIIQGYWTRAFAWEDDAGGAASSPAESRAFQACCNTYGGFEGPSPLSQEELSTCSPWGPPMPPRMPRIASTGVVPDAESAGAA